MARPSARSAASSWCCAGALSCSAKRALRSMAASSRPSTRGIGTLPRPRCIGGWRRLPRAAPAISRSSTAPIARGEAVPAAKITRLNEKIATLRQEIQRLNGLNTQMMQTEDKQISLTDPDARSMATSGRGSGMVGYNVQSAVDTKHHLIVSHEVTNVGSDRGQLSHMSEQARSAIGSETIEVVADRGYFSGEEILACEEAGITVYLPKPITSGINAKGRFGKQDFVYVAADDVYFCPAGEQLTYRYTNEEDGKTLRRYWTTACQACALKSKCTTGKSAGSRVG